MTANEAIKIVKKHKGLMFAWVSLTDDEGEYFEVNKKNTLLILEGLEADQDCNVVLRNSGDIYIN